MNLSTWEKTGKSIIAFVYAVVTVIIPLASGDHHIDASEGIIIALAVGNNLLVYIVPITQRFGAAKSIINAVLAALAIAQTVITTGADWTNPTNLMLVISAFLVAVGVTVAPAASPIQNAKVGVGSDAATPI